MKDPMKNVWKIKRKMHEKSNEKHVKNQAKHMWKIKWNACEKSSETRVKKSNETRVIKVLKR
jgi:hypothetical protein